MGYLSDVRVMVKKEDYAKLKEQKLELMESMDVLTEGKKQVYFGWDNIKWYDDYDDVKEFMDALKNIETYTFTRLGEEQGDIEERAVGDTESLLQPPVFSRFDDDCVDFWVKH